jgi:hypothetical protein
VVDRQYVDFVVADQSVDDPVRTVHDFSDQGIFEFWNRSAGFRKWNQAIRCRNQLSNND